MLVKNGQYPLVNVYMTMERSTMFHGKINYFDWAMFNSYVTNYQRVNGGFPKWGIPKSPWVSILDWSNDLDDLGLVLFEKTSI